MLGGSFLVAVFRNTVSAGLMLSFFLMLDRPRFPMKKTILYGQENLKKQAAMLSMDL